MGSTADRAKTLVFCGFALVLLVDRTAGTNDRQQQQHQQQMVETPRVERSGAETSHGCEGGWCKSQQSQVGTIWFGPRLGRRRRSFVPSSSSSSQFANNRKNDAITANEFDNYVDDGLLMDLVENMPVAKLQRLATSLGLTTNNNNNNNNANNNNNNDDKRLETTFTPRLGRRDLEGTTMNHPLRELARLLYEQLRELDDDYYAQQKQQTPPPNFPPRLGRNLTPEARLLRERVVRYVAQQLDF